jgi:O-6-methylguanine DNA methyltransferase
MSSERVVHTCAVRLSLGEVHLATVGQGLCLTVLGARRACAQLAAWIGRHESGARLVESTEGMEDAIAELEAYGEGELKSFDLSLDLRGTPFQLRVWQALREIPYGEVRTYGQLAASLGQPGASRAVGGANGRNPIPLIVPCHRVVASDGLGGFTGGLEWKERLLAHEEITMDRGTCSPIERMASQ